MSVYNQIFGLIDATLVMLGKKVITSYDEISAISSILDSEVFRIAGRNI